MFDSHHLKGSYGIITGGSSGIGLAIARYLTEHGAKITITGRDEDKLKEAAAGLGENAIYAVGDVRKKEQVIENFKTHLNTYGEVNFLINNAAGNFICPLEKMSENAFRAVNDIVCLGTFLWSQTVFPAMRAQGAGQIINIGTNYAFGQSALVGHSGAAKAAVLNLTKTMAVEWGPYGIRSNMIAPGPVEGTEGVRRLLGSPESQQTMKAFLPLKRMAQGWEIGALAAFLISPLASYITGAVIPVDGGMHLTIPGLFPVSMHEKLLKQLES